jgi:hypothetical protein
VIPTDGAVIPIDGPSFDFEFEFEAMVISFQRLSVDSVSEDDYRQRIRLITKWETILCKHSSSVSIREKSVKNREEVVCAQEFVIQLLKKRSANLECKICLHDCCPVCRAVIQGFTNVCIT